MLITVESARGSRLHGQVVHDIGKVIGADKLVVDHPGQRQQHAAAQASAASDAAADKNQPAHSIAGGTGGMGRDKRGAMGNRPSTLKVSQRSVSRTKSKTRGARNDRGGGGGDGSEPARTKKSPSRRSSGRVDDSGVGQVFSVQEVVLSVTPSSHHIASLPIDLPRGRTA